MNETDYLTDAVEPMTISDLQKMCDDRVEETVILEFKPCNELRSGSTYYAHDGTQAERTRDMMLDELSRDVSALLNSAGGTIIYGIRERNSRARELDSDNAFEGVEAKPERVIQWLRSNVKPPPTINVYRVFETQNDPASKYYLVISVPQGQQAYMARDSRFYKRVGNIVQPMEQYEVVDVMNRTRAAALATRVALVSQPQFQDRHTWGRVRLEIKITSTNFIASEYGAIKLTVAYPLRMGSRMVDSFPRATFIDSTGLPLAGSENVPHAQSIRIGWGASMGSVIFPGDWHDFFGNTFSIEVPSSLLLPNSTYLFQIELYTLNSQSKEGLFSIRQRDGADFELIQVSSANYEQIVDAFWATYDAALSSLQARDNP